MGTADRNMRIERVPSRVALRARPVRPRARTHAPVAFSLAAVVVLVLLAGSESRGWGAGAGDTALPNALAVMPTGEGSAPDAEPALSDWYWAAMNSYVPSGFHYASLADITADSHLIIRGRVIGLSQGGIEPFDDTFYVKSMPVTFGVVAVDEVLKGSPESKAPGTILVARLAGGEMSETDLPQDEVILFLKNYAEMRRDFGALPAGDTDDRYYYVRPNGYQAVLRNRDGLVAVPSAPEGWWDQYGPFPSDINDLPFGVVASEVLQAAGLSQVGAQ